MQTVRQRIQMISVAFLMAGATGSHQLLGAGHAPPGDEPELVAPHTASVMGVIVRLALRSRPWRLTLTTMTQETIHLEIPPDVTVAWKSGEPVLLEAVTPGQWVKVRYVKARGSVGQVRSIHFIVGESTTGPAPTSGTGGAPGTPSRNGVRAPQDSSGVSERTPKSFSSGGRNVPTDSAQDSPTAPTQSSGPSERSPGVHEESRTAPALPTPPELPAVPDMPSSSSVELRKTP